MWTFLVIGTNDCDVIFERALLDVPDEHLWHVLHAREDAPARGVRRLAQIADEGRHRGKFFLERNIREMEGDNFQVYLVTRIYQSS